MLPDLVDEIGLRERPAADPDHRDAAVAHVGGPGVQHELLQITVATADQRQLWVRLL